MGLTFCSWSARPVRASLDAMLLLLQPSPLVFRVILPVLLVRVHFIDSQVSSLQLGRGNTVAAD